MSNSQNQDRKWIEHLSDEDFTFVKRFILASGSLKDAAGFYGVTYPTIRLRLDRLIEKIKIVESMQPMSDFERLARCFCAEGKLDIHTLKDLLAAHKKETEAHDETNGSGHD